MTDAAHNSLLVQLAEQRRTLAVLLRQRANLGSDHAPPGVHHGIEDARAEIARIKRLLGESAIAVDDHADDSEQPAAQFRAPALAGTASPYLGLLTFQEADANHFFGREALVADLLAKARQAPFLAVLGPSGSGKSSAVRAGLLPALKRGALPGSDAWIYCPPIKPGARPVNSLAAALASLPGAAALGSVFDLQERLTAHPDALLVAADALCAGRAGARLVLLVDQAEELWTLAPADPEAQASFITTQQQPFMGQILSALQAPDRALLVLLTMRADFLHRAAEHPALARAIAEHDVIVSPMTRTELQQAIVRPAAALGATFEPGLADELVEQSAERPGALPLLEYTLLELWQQIDERGTLTWQAFNRLGGVEGALAARADAILAEHYPEAAELAQLRKLLVRLVQPSEGAADTRRRRSLADLTPAGSSTTELQALLQPLVDARLLTTGADASAERESVDMAHEALIRAWPTFSKWIADARDDLRLQAQLEEASSTWEQSGESADFLWGGLRLANAEAWVARSQPALNMRDTRFLTTCQIAEQQRKTAETAAQREREALLEARANAERRNASRLRIFLSAVGVLLLIASGFLVYAVDRQRAAQQAAAQANEARAAAEHQTRVAGSQARAAEALFRLASGDPDQAALLTRAALITDTQSFEPIVNRALHRIVEDAPARQVLGASADQLTGARWSQDARRVLTWGNDGIARIWDAQAGTASHTLAGHTERVIGALWSQDEQRVLTWSYDATARIWDAQSGQPLRVLKGHRNALIGGLWSQDERRVLTWSFDNTARIWDAQTGQALQILNGHTNIMSGALWSPDGQYVLTWSYDQTARIWDAQTGQALQILKGHTGTVAGALWSPDARRVLTWGEDRTARIWDAQTAASVHVLIGHDDAVYGALWNKDASRVLTWSADRSARIWDAQTGRAVELISGHTGRIFGALWSTDEQRVLTWGEDRTARIWDVQTSQALQVFEGHTDSVYGASWSPDEQRVLTWSTDQTARIWDVQTGRSLQILAGHTNRVVGANWSPDERRVLTWSDDGTARIWHLTRQSPKIYASLSGPVYGALWSPDEQRVLTWSDDGTARIWDARTGQFVRVLGDTTLSITGVIWGPDGGRVLTWGADGATRIWDAQTGQSVQVLKGHTSWVVGARWSHDEGRILAWSADKTARIWNAQTGQPLQVFKGHTDMLGGAEWSQDEDRVLTWSQDGSVRIWDAQTGRQLRMLGGHAGWVYGASWSKDEGRVLIIGGDGAARIWDAQTGKTVQVFQDQATFVSGALWSPDEQRVLTWSDDGTARIWDAQTGTLLQILAGHTERVAGAVWSKDARQVLTWSEDRTARIWDAQTGRGLQVLEGHAAAIYGASWSQDEQRVLTWSADKTARSWVTSTRLLGAELTNRVCLRFSDQEIQQIIPSWRGCDAELLAAQADLEQYNAFVGAP